MSKTELTKNLIIRIFICGCIIIGVMFVSSNLGGRFDNRQQSIDIQNYIVNGVPVVVDGYYFGSTYNRVLFGLMLQATDNIKIFSVTEWYLILRILSGLVAFCVFWWGTTSVVKINNKLMSAGVLLLGFSLLFTFNHGLELPSDVFDLLFFALILSFSVKKQYLLVLLACMIGAANRESVVFASVIWLCLYGIDVQGKPVWREALRAVVLGVTTYGLVIFLRYWFGGIRAITENTQSFTFVTDIQIMLREMLPLDPFDWPFLLIAMFSLWFLWLFSNRKSITDVYRRILAANLLIGVLSLVFGRISELRIFIPSLTILAMVSLWVEASTVPTTRGDQAISQASETAKVV